MSLKIEADCINCEMCVPVCPNAAISMGEAVFVIDPDKCTECVGFYASPQCIKACPIHCISKTLQS